MIVEIAKHKIERHAGARRRCEFEIVELRARQPRESGQRPQRKNQNEQGDAFHGWLPPLLSGRDDAGDDAVG